MGDSIKYVCLSDLHLGTPDSILTEKDPAVPSESLRRLGFALTDLLQQFNQGEPPTLILLGDVLDLGLSRVENAATVFQWLMEVLFAPANKLQLLSPTIVYVPGNHDHLVWTSARDQAYAAGILDKGPSRKLDPPQSTTPMFQTPDHMMESAMLTNLARTSMPYTQNLSVRVAYPNFGVHDKDHSRCVAFHHGHFIESAYRMASTVRSFFEPGYTPPDIAQLERDNANWIDFFWSTFGETGPLGTDASDLYTVMQDGAATDRLLFKLEKQMMRGLMPYVPMSGEHEIRHYAKAAAKALLDATAERYADLERNSKLSVLSDDSISGLRWYLEEPLYGQMKDELGIAPDDLDLTFIFGHTHKPFADQLPLSKYRLPVKVFNTGGWTFNSPDMTPVEGAAMVLVDPALNVAQVRLFSDPMNGTSAPVAIPPNGAYPWAAPSNAPDPGANPLAYFVNQVLEDDDSWDDFGRAVADALETRRASVMERFDAEAIGARVKGSQR